MADDKQDTSGVGGGSGAANREVRRNENEPEDRYGIGDIVVDAEDPAAESNRDGDPTSAKEGGLGNPEGVTGGTANSSSATGEPTG
jgi:hypothetical protein